MKNHIIGLLISFLIFILILNLIKSKKYKKENFSLDPNSVKKDDLINQMFNPFANFINIGDTTNTDFRAYNSQLSDPRPLDYINLNLDKTIVINDITYKDIKPILERIERKGKDDMGDLLLSGVSPDYFEIKNYIQKIDDLQIANSNKETYLYPLNYTTSHQNIFNTRKSKLPQFDNGNKLLLFLFIEYFRLKFKDNFKYISILRYKVYEGKIDRNLNYYYKAQADYFVDGNYTIWTINFEFFMIKIDETLKTYLKENTKLHQFLEKYKLANLNTDDYLPVILSYKCVGNYFQDQLFLTMGYSPFDYNYGKYKGDTIDNPFEHDFIYQTDDLKEKQFIGIDENFTGSIPIEAPNAGNIDKTFNNLENPRPYLKKDYITQIINTQNQNPLANQYACFNTDNGDIVFDIYSMKECNRDYDDYFRIKPKGIFDKSCNKDDECPFYNKNTNYPNHFGGCKNGFCELPQGLMKLGYKYYLSKTKPLCYNCYTKDWLPISNLHPCCEEQNDRKKYPHLKGPDYAFKGDLVDRTNYYNKKYCKYYPNKDGDPIGNTVCEGKRTYYNV